jgi:hypothetical protein
MVAASRPHRFHVFQRLGTRHRAQRAIRRSASTISRSMLVVNQLGLLQLVAEHDQRLLLVSTSGNSVAQSGMEVEGDPNPGQRDVVRPVDRGRVQAYSECDLDHSPDSREGGRW